MDLDPATTPEYARWERWRDNAAPTAHGFLNSADAEIMAAQYQEWLMDDGLAVAGLDRAVGGGRARCPHSPHLHGVIRKVVQPAAQRGGGSVEAGAPATTSGARAAW